MNKTKILINKILISLLIISAPLQSQQFGRNKIQYDDFKFKIMHTTNFDIYHYPQEKHAVHDAGRMIERWYYRFSDFLDYEIEQKQPLILYANHADFQQTNVISSLLGQGTGGVTEGLKKRIVIPLTGVYSQNDHVLGHELVHAFQYNIAENYDKGLNRMQRLPLWLIEGMAEYLSSGSHSTLTAMWLRDAVVHDDVPTIDDISSDPRYFPYRYGQALWAFMASKWGDPVVPQIFRESINTSLDSAYRKVIGLQQEEISKQWVKAVKNDYTPQLQGRDSVAEIGQAVIKDESDSGPMNLSPVISPDGKYAAFLGRQDVFTLDLYLADLQKGKIIKKLVSSTTDAHFDALRFMNSAGTWSPDGSKFAFVVFKDGDNAISVIDVKSTDVLQTITLKQVDALNYLDWSPDGNRLVISGSKGGISDLYLYNFRTDQTRQITEGRYAEIQPDWSSDGRYIAFVTDRGDGNNFNTLQTGQLSLALYDTLDREISTLQIFANGKHINPSFSNDSAELFFVSDQDGFSDIYSYNINNRQLKRITKVVSGISGLTAESPCLSVAGNSGDLLFTVFDNRKYKLRLITKQNIKGTVISSHKISSYKKADKLPLVNSLKGNFVEIYLKQYQKGLPPDTTFALSDYDPDLLLKYAGNLSLGGGSDRFGTYLGGGGSLVFADFLNDHMLGVAAQINGRFKDIGGQVMYLNRDNRFNWGASISRIPYRSRSVGASIDSVQVDGEKVYGTTYNILDQRIFDSQAALLGEYPLSINRRIEASIGYTRIGFDNELTSIFTINGVRYDEDRQSLDAPPALDLVQTSLGYVGDYSFFGFTSPVKGRRYRAEIEATFGSLEYYTLLLDYRQYIFIEPFTLAFRGMHMGRYAGNAESRRLPPLYLGYETFIRGYNAFASSECIEGSNGADCPEFNRLLGSRIIVTNFEFRVPLFGVEQFGLITFNFLPTELSLFFDGGLAWTKSEAPDLKWATKSSKRIPVFSSGIAARFNLFGVIVPQIYYAFPFQRPQKDAVFGFVFAMGW